MEQNLHTCPRENPTNCASRQRWSKRILNFHVSWFVSSMSTGILAQLISVFPYPTDWLHGVAYSFWVLVIVMFCLFLICSILQCVCFPRKFFAIFEHFNQSSYLGAIPITLDTIINGICIFYSGQPAGVWAAHVLYWVAVLMSVTVGCIVVFATRTHQSAPKLEDVTPVWMLSFIPLIVTSSAGGEVTQYLGPEAKPVVLAISFLMWSLGITMCFIIMTVYFWRLTRHSLPARDLIVSCFIPMGPTGMGAFAIQNLAFSLSSLLEETQFLFYPIHTVPTSSIIFLALSEMICWLAVLVSFFLVSMSTFWLIEAAFSLSIGFPRKIHMGLWASVFPNAAYSAALCRLAQDLDNKALRGWAAACTIASLLLWFTCAVTTLYKSIRCTKLFFPRSAKNIISSVPKI